MFGGNSEKKNAENALPKKPSSEQPGAAAADSGNEDGDEGQEHGAAGKGYVETKQGKFGRKKVIETNLGPDGKPVYTGYQLEQAMQRMKSKKKAREQAKKEEKAYVEYRKAEILRTFQPKVGTLRLGDEVYPKRRRVGMGFGERKAHYLAIRPKPKYATWIGRKKGIIEAKAQPKPNDAATVITDHSMLPEHSVRAHTKHDDKEEPSRKDGQTKEEKEIEKPVEIVEKEGGGGGGKKDEGGEKKIVETVTKKKDEKKESLPKPPKKTEIKYVVNKTCMNPIKPDGQPIWCGDHNEDFNDDDLPVDMDILEKVCSGEKVLCQRPFNKKEFLPFGPIAAMKTDDVLFVRETTLFANTVESVISLQPEDDKKKKLPPPFPYKIKWSDNVRVKMFHPASRIPHKLDKSWTEQFHMVTRDAAGKKAA